MNQVLWILLGLLGGLAGIVFLVWLGTGVWHGFLKPENPPGFNDEKWSRDQGKDA